MSIHYIQNISIETNSNKKKIFEQINPIKLQMFLCFINMFGLLISSVGIIVIKWEYTTDLNFIFHMACILLFLLSLIFSLISFLYNQYKYSDEKCSSIFVKFSYFFLLLSLIGLALNILSLVFAINNFNEVSKTLETEKGIMIVIMIGMIIFFVVDMLGMFFNIKTFKKYIPFQIVQVNFGGQQISVPKIISK